MAEKTRKKYPSFCMRLDARSLSLLGMLRQHFNEVAAAHLFIGPCSDAEIFRAALEALFDRCGLSPAKPLPPAGEPAPVEAPKVKARRARSRPAGK